MLLTAGIKHLFKLLWSQHIRQWNVMHTRMLTGLTALTHTVYPHISPVNIFRCLRNSTFLSVIYFLNSTSFPTWETLTFSIHAPPPHLPTSSIVKFQGTESPRHNFRIRPTYVTEYLKYTVVLYWHDVSLWSLLLWKQIASTFLFRQSPAWTFLATDACRTMR